MQGSTSLDREPGKDAFQDQFQDFSYVNNDALRDLNSARLAAALLNSARTSTNNNGSDAMSSTSESVATPSTARRRFFVRSTDDGKHVPEFCPASFECNALLSPMHSLQHSMQSHGASPLQSATHSMQSPAHSLDSPDGRLRPRGMLTSSASDGTPGSALQNVMSSTDRGDSVESRSVRMGGGFTSGRPSDLGRSERSNERSFERGTLPESSTSRGGGGVRERSLRVSLLGERRPALLPAGNSAAAAAAQLVAQLTEEGCSTASPRLSFDRMHESLERTRSVQPGGALGGRAASEGRARSGGRSRHHSSGHMSSGRASPTSSLPPHPRGPPHPETG